MRIFTIVLVFLATALRSGAFTVDDKFVLPFAGKVLTPIEGIWLWNSGAQVAIEADSFGAIKLTVVDSPDPDVETPVIIGSGRFSGKANTYDIELITGSDLNVKKGKARKAKYVLTLIDNRRLSLKPYSTSYKVNFWRMVPYLFRFSVSKNKRPDDLDGAVRVWPRLGTPEIPVIL